MSAMSASSPPAGLMPLSLISEHKSSVPGVQSLPRTPEKMNQPQQPPNALPQPPQQVGQPLGMKIPAGVANGMEVPQPSGPFPNQPHEPMHPAATVENPGVALPPSSHLPNLPSGGKGEASGPSPPDNGTSPVEKSTSAAEAPALAPAPEVQIPEIRLPIAPGLTITPIGFPMSHTTLPPVVPPPTVPVEPVQPTVAIPVTPIASVPPPVVEQVGGANISAVRPLEHQEVKSVPPPERAPEKKQLVTPPQAVDCSSVPTPQAAAPAPSSLVPPPVIKDAARAPPPAPKPAPVPSESPVSTQSSAPAATPPVQPPPVPAQQPPPSTQPASAGPVKDTQAPVPQVSPASASTAPAQPAKATPAVAPPSTATPIPEAQEAPSAQPPQAATPQASESAPVPQAKPKRTPKPKPAPVVEKKTPAKETSSEKDGDGKPRRKRLPTQPYQSPIPELNLIAKINKIDKTPTRPQEDKLIVFYRNEFLAVRNAEGSYYVCQAMQNIYKSSSKIKIRWLSQDPNGENYSPDFYDHTEFDCILTNLNLQRVGKDQFKLPEVEAKRTDSILKRAIDVEKGIVVADESTITEEHPDGLDLSLYRNEEQLKKRKKKPKKLSRGSKPESKSDSSGSAKSVKTPTEPTKKLPARSGAATKRKAAPSPVPAKRGMTSAPVKKSSPAVATPTPSAAAKKEPAKKESAATPVAAKSVTKRKAVATPASAPPADNKRSRRDPTTKTKSAVAAASASGTSTPKPPASSTLRRPTRNSK